LNLKKIKDEQTRLAELKNLIFGLPNENRAVLNRIVALIISISYNSDVNSMTISNLAVCFAPNIFRSASTDLFAAIRDAPFLLSITRSIIENCALFRDPEESNGPVPKVGSSNQTLQMYQFGNTPNNHTTNGSNSNESSPKVHQENNNHGNENFKNEEIIKAKKAVLQEIQQNKTETSNIKPVSAWKSATVVNNESKEIPQFSTLKRPAGYKPIAEEVFRPLHKRSGSDQFAHVQQLTKELPAVPIKNRELFANIGTPSPPHSSEPSPRTNKRDARAGSNRFGQKITLASLEAELSNLEREKNEKESIKNTESEKDEKIRQIMPIVEETAKVTILREPEPMYQPIIKTIIREPEPVKAKKIVFNEQTPLQAHSQVPLHPLPQPPKEKEAGSDFSSIMKNVEKNFDSKAGRSVRYSARLRESVRMQIRKSQGSKTEPYRLSIRDFGGIDTADELLKEVDTFIQDLEEQQDFYYSLSKEIEDGTDILAAVDELLTEAENEEIETEPM